MQETVFEAAEVDGSAFNILIDIEYATPSSSALFTSERRIMVPEPPVVVVGIAI
jgi:hypothetical protein